MKAKSAPLTVGEPEVSLGPCDTPRVWQGSDMRRSLRLLASAVVIVAVSALPAHAESRVRTDPINDIGPVYGMSKAASVAYDITRLRVRNGPVNVDAMIWMRTLSPHRKVGLTFRMSKGDTYYSVTTRRFADRSTSKARLWRFPPGYDDPLVAVRCDITATWAPAGSRRIHLVVPQKCFPEVVNDFSVEAAPWVNGQDYFDSTRYPFVVRFD